MTYQSLALELSQYAEGFLDRASGGSMDAKVDYIELIQAKVSEVIVYRLDQFIRGESR